MLSFAVFWSPVVWRVLQNHHCLPVCPSISSAFFSGMAVSFFLIFGTMVKIGIFKNWRGLFSGKLIFAQIWAKGPKWSQIKVFWVFWKILSLIFLGNDLKWKLILWLIFHHQSHIWQNCGSWVAVSQSNCRILLNVISQERSESWSYLRYADKHWIL